jgi:hypothetical protein
MRRQYVVYGRPDWIYAANCVRSPVSPAPKRQSPFHRVGRSDIERAVRNFKQNGLQSCVSGVVGEAHWRSGQPETRARLLTQTIPNLDCTNAGYSDKDLGFAFGRLAGRD